MHLKLYLLINEIFNWIIRLRVVIVCIGVNYFKCLLIKIIVNLILRFTKTVRRSIFALDNFYVHVLVLLVNMIFETIKSYILVSNAVEILWIIN